MRKAVASLVLAPFLLFFAFPVGSVVKDERRWQDGAI